MYGIIINVVRKLLYIISLIGFSCNSSRLYTEYRLYRRDYFYPFPREKLTIQLFNDSTGLFVNKDKGREPFSQRFGFSEVKNVHLIVENLDQTDSHIISLKQGDTIILDGRRLHFIYRGDIKYILSFKKR